MNEKDQERYEVLGIIGAGLIAALVAALAVPAPAEGQVPVVVESSHAVAVKSGAPSPGR
jgi:phosphotransferase system IIA component